MKKMTADSKMEKYRSKLDSAINYSQKSYFKLDAW